MNKKAFTLIELMIVVVILGVLMATVLPKLTWWQAKARDVARQADLTAISQALAMYSSENNNYPVASEACLGSTDAAWSGAVADLARHLKWNKVPTDPIAAAKVWKTANLKCSDWEYYYSSLANNWFDNSGYIVCADMENYASANFLATNLPGTSASTVTTISALSAKVATETEADANDSIYCIIN